jgi:hypothetical protein
LILAHVNYLAVEHAELSLQVYRTLYENIETTEEEDEPIWDAIELAEEVLENTIKFREEEASAMKEYESDMESDEEHNETATNEASDETNDK